jgi:hypothetical protein
MYYTIYETTNKINGKKYIGKHITSNPYDNYLGSGLYLINAIEKYGSENFEKKVLFIFDNKEDMENKERELVNEQTISDKNYYNISLGGQGGVTVMFDGHPLYEKTKNKLKTTQQNRSKEMSDIVKKLHEEKRVGMYGKKQSENQKKIVSEKLRGKKKDPESIRKQKESLLKTLHSSEYVHPNKGRTYDSERLKRMSEITKNIPKKICPHCNVVMDAANYARYHGDKCKNK